MTSAKRSRPGLAGTYLLPSLVGLVSGIGLVLALLGDDVWDAASWVGVGLPVAVVGYYAWLHESKQPE